MGEFYTRKRLRLENYDYTQKNYVYVTICTENRARLLGKIIEPKTEADPPLIELYQAGIVTEQFTKTIRGIDKYVIMPNHVHMIVKNEAGENISTKIRAWKSMITRSLGKNIWQRSFYDHVIRDEQDYRIRWKYIDDNPTKWAIDPDLKK